MNRTTALAIAVALGGSALGLFGFVSLVGWEEAAQRLGVAFLVGGLTAFAAMEAANLLLDR